MAEILQIVRALGLYALVLAIALPNLWLLGKMLRVGRMAYVRNLEIFTLGMLVCLPAFYLEAGLRRVSDGWIQQLFYLSYGNTVERTWLKNLFVVAPVEEGFKALALVLGLWRLRKLAPGHAQLPAAAVFWAALLAAGFASFENVLYALNTPGAWSAGFGVIGLRAVTSSLVHCAATSMVGLAIGLQRRYRLAWWLSGFVGLAAAMLIHAGYNVLTQIDLPAGGSGQGRMLVQAAAAVVASGLPPLLAYALGLIAPLPAAAELPTSGALPAAADGGRAEVSLPAGFSGPTESGNPGSNGSDSAE